MSICRGVNGWALWGRGNEKPRENPPMDRFPPRLAASGLAQEGAHLPAKRHVGVLRPDLQHRGSDRSESPAPFKQRLLPNLFPADLAHDAPCLCQRIFVYAFWSGSSIPLILPWLTLITAAPRNPIPESVLWKGPHFALRGLSLADPCLFAQRRVPHHREQPRRLPLRRLRALGQRCETGFSMLRFFSCLVVRFCSLLTGIGHYFAN